jgi:hypothetical protein
MLITGRCCRWLAAEWLHGCASFPAAGVFVRYQTGRTARRGRACPGELLRSGGVRLDFKAALYGRGDSERRALAGDAAALADTAGGVIVLGVAEDDQHGLWPRLGAGHRRGGGPHPAGDRLTDAPQARGRCSHRAGRRRRTRCWRPTRCLADEPGRCRVCGGRGSRTLASYWFSRLSLARRAERLPRRTWPCAR